MKNIDEVKAILRFCNTMHKPVGEITALLEGLNALRRESGTVRMLCSENCRECTTPTTLTWVWPELLQYDELLSEDDDFGRLP